MTPERALHFNVDPDACRVVAESNRYGGDWRIEYYGRVVASFYPDEVRQASRWVANLRRLRDARS